MKRIGLGLLGMLMLAFVVTVQATSYITSGQLTITN